MKIESYQLILERFLPIKYESPGTEKPRLKAWFKFDCTDLEQNSSKIKNMNSQQHGELYIYFYDYLKDMQGQVWDQKKVI